MSRSDRREGNGLSVHLAGRVGSPLYAAPTDGLALSDHARLLEDVLAPYPRARIVLSTSWVRHYRGSIRRVSRGLTPALRERGVGATFHSRMDLSVFNDVPRGSQVWSDVLRCKPDAWLALDDDVENWPSWCEDRRVRTDPVLGISAMATLAKSKPKLDEMDGRG